MEHPSLYPEMLDKIPYPTLLVENGVIAQCNHAAVLRQIEPGSLIADLISTGSQEYKAYTGGKLCIVVTIANTTYNTSVIRNEGIDYFFLESEYEDPELRAMALAAQHLREPLSGALTSLAELSEQVDEATQMLVRQINKDLQRLHRAVNNMSDAAGYEKQRFSRTSMQNATAIIAQIMEKAQQLALAGDRRLKYQSINVPVYAYMDSEKLERALLNMLSNALRHSPAGSEVCVQLDRSDDRLYISVTNQILPDSHNSNSNLFTQYLREPGIENDRKGIGLGMTIIRNAAIAHGGTLLCESIDSQTYRFTITIAIKHGSENTLRSPVILPFDYAGGYDHTLLELSDVLSTKLYDT